MYLSRLTLNAFCRHVREDLASPYQMHKTIMRAFPSEAEGGPGRVLFRTEQPADPWGERTPVVLVQSEKRPDWSRITEMRELADYAQKVECKPFEPAVVAGQRLAFRLWANPTVKREGKRHALWKEDLQQRWLERKAQAGGFRVLAYSTAAAGTRRDQISRNDVGRHNASFYGVRFDGVLQVENAEAFRATLQAGIGSGKGVGFGMLSIATA